MNNARNVLARLVAGAFAASALLAVPACYYGYEDDDSASCVVDRLIVQAPSTACAGDRFDVRVLRDTRYRDVDLTADAVFATSDPDVLVIEGSKALARAPGVVRLTAIVGSKTANKTLLVKSCSDAGEDAEASDAAPADGAAADTATPDTATPDTAVSDATSGDDAAATDADDAAAREDSSTPDDSSTPEDSTTPDDASTTDDAAAPDAEDAAPDAAPTGDT